MKRKLMEYLCCPVSMDELELQIIEEYGENNEVISGVLFSNSEMVYPIVKGVPRMKLESLLEFNDFLFQHVDDWKERLRKIQKRHGALIKDAQKKNISTSRSFGLEWSFFDYSNDSTWGMDKTYRRERFLTLLEEDKEFLEGKSIIDIGSGNGVLTSSLSEYGCEAFGLELSDSVENAHQYNNSANVHYVQADLQYPPFKREMFDIVFSSGVIHHTNNTELSFSIINELVKKGGKLYVWLYMPINRFKDKLFNGLRPLSTRVHPRLVAFLIYIFVSPIFLFKKLFRLTEQNYRENIVSYLDRFTPQYRFEHSPSETEIWYRKRNYDNVKVTVYDDYGYGIYGIKNAN